MKKVMEDAVNRRESSLGSRPRVTVLMKEERSRKKGETEPKPNILISKRSSADLARKRHHEKPKLMQQRGAS